MITGSVGMKIQKKRILLNNSFHFQCIFSLYGMVQLKTIKLVGIGIDKVAEKQLSFLNIFVIRS